MKIESAFYNLDIPDSYSIESEDGVNTIYDPEGVGAINISAYEIPKSYEFDLEYELADFVSSVTKIAPENADHVFETSDHRCYTEYIDEDSAWRFWLHFENNKAIFISYNCKIEQQEEETEMVDSIVDSLKV